MAKIEPTLADSLGSTAQSTALFNGPGVPSHIGTGIRQALTSARKFVLTNDAAVRVAEALRAYPEMIVQQGEFAIPPFETCWIEFPNREYGEILQNQRSILAPDVFTRNGFLFHNGYVYNATGMAGVAPIDAFFYPMRFRLHQPMPWQAHVDMLASIQLTPDGYIDRVWGDGLGNQIGPRLKRRIISQHSWEFFKLPNTFGEGDETARQLMVGGIFGGELPSVIAMLLMINQPSNILTFRDVPRERKLTAKGHKIFMAHSVVTINLDERKHKRLLSAMHTHAYAEKRRHEVRGHYCHDRAGRSACDHSWVEVDPRKWECSVCHGKRWWRKAFERGNAAIGFVSQLHVVKTDKDHD